MTMHLPRRQFLKSVGAGAAGAMAVGYAPKAWGYLAGETLNVGCIGTGGRCQYLMQRLVKMPGVRIAAVCDVWDKHLDEARKKADPKAVALTDYREMLDRKDIDAVVIASPDHWHVPMTIDACAAGKDVYVEKPLTHDLAEGAAVIDAVNKHQRIVQVGTQQRSMPQFLQALEIVRSGQLGKIHKVHMTWNRNQERWNRNKGDVDPKSVRWNQFLGSAKDQPFDEYRFRNWRWFWDFGGGILTDLMVHWIDVAYWFLGWEHPTSAATIGDHFRAKDLWETPDTVQTLLRFPEQETQAYFEGTFVNARNAAMIEFMGSEATLYLDRARYEIHPERNSKLPASEVVLDDGPRGADFYGGVDGEMYHLTNWVECIRSRKTPNAPVEEAVKSAAAAHLANAAYRSGQVAQWNRS